MRGVGAFGTASLLSPVNYHVRLLALLAVNLPDLGGLLARGAVIWAELAGIFGGVLIEVRSAIGAIHYLEIKDGGFIAICSTPLSLVVIVSIISASQTVFEADVGYVRVHIEAAIFTVLRAGGASLHGLVRIRAIGTLDTAARS